jgi:ribonuclease HI
MATWDLKSGYFHVPIHKEFRKYFCFKVGGIIFYFKVLCFGFSQACYVFTKLMQEPAIELRSRGIPISDYIDDSFTAASSRERCLRQSVLAVLFFATLGAFMGLPKCNLWPQLLVKWLEFLVDSEKEEFRVGEAKLLKLKKFLGEVLAKRDTSPRTIVALAGKILALSPAVLPAALYSRESYLTLKGKASWDYVFPSPQSVVDAAQFWLENVDRFNGRKWWQKAVTVKAVVDASAVGYGGFITVGSEAPEPFAGTFSAEETTQSSTAREVRGYAAALKAAAQRSPDQVRDAAILLEGDNQGAISALNHLKSPIQEINQCLRKVFQLCCEQRFDVVARWIPRDTLEEADALSRLPDPADWGLSTSELRSVFKHFGRKPTLYLFASDVHHVVDRFVSRFFTPGCEAVDATKLDWKVFASPAEVVWVFPPYRQVSLALSLLESAKLEAFVCMPIKGGLQ